jgi:hypothetical protein
VPGPGSALAVAFTGKSINSQLPWQRLEISRLRNSAHSRHLFTFTMAGTGNIVELYRRGRLLTGASHSKNTGKFFEM